MEEGTRRDGRGDYRNFLEDGVIERPVPAELLDYKYRLSDLKTMLRNRGLPVSGRKKELIDRLVAADSDGIKSIVSTLDLLQCFQMGRSIAETFLLREEETRIRVEEQVQEKLTERTFRDAVLLVSSFESDQVFSLGLNVDWKNYDPAANLAMLESMFSRKPKILASINDEQFEKLRIAAAMMHLWGTDRLRLKGWLPDFDKSSRLDTLSAARMVIFDAKHQRTMSLYKAAGVKRVEISSIEDLSLCDNCAELAGRTYELQEVPDLPYELCTSDMGCRCMAIAGTFS